MESSQWEREEFQLWLSWALWCIAIFGLYSWGLLFTLAITLTGGALGWHIAMICNWKNSVATFVALINSATVVACGIAWLMYYALSSAADL